MQKNEPVSAAGSQLAAGAVAVTVLLFVSLPDPGMPPATVIGWLAAGPVIYAADTLFLRQSRTAGQLALLNTACGAALLTVTLLSCVRRDGTFVVIAVIGCLVLAVQAANLAMKGQTLSRAVSWLDAALIVLVLFAAWLGGMGFSLAWVVPSAVGCAVAMLGLVAFRAGGGQSAAGWGFLAGALAVLCGVSALIFHFAGEGAGRGVVALWSRICAFGAWVWARINQFMAWLVSLFPSPGEEAAELGSDVAAASVEGDTDVTMSISIPTAFWIVLGIAVLVVLVVVLCLFGRSRTGRDRVTLRREARVRRTHPTLWSVLRRKLADLREGLRLCLFLRRHRGSVLGSFFALERCARGRGWRRENDATPREFLTALLPRAEGDEELTAALTGLIDAVEQVVYSPSGQDRPYPAADVLRKGRRTLFRNKSEK